MTDTEPLLHAEELGPDFKPTGHTLCEDGWDNGGLLANQPWQITCQDCLNRLEADDERAADESLSGDPDYHHEVD